MNKWKCYKGWIYLYVNKINGKRYVGQTVDLHSRCARHRNCTDLYIDKAIQKYGIDNFKIVVLEVFTCSSIKIRTKRLNEWEIYWIEKLHTYWYDYPDTGYNLTKGGNCPSSRRKRGAKIHIYDYTTKEEYEKAKYQLRKDKVKPYQEKYREEHREELKKWAKEYRDLHKDEINKRRRELRKLKPKLVTKEQRQKQKEASKRYLEKNKERLKEKNKIKYQKIKEAMTEEERLRRCEYYKQWRKNHPNYDKEYRQQHKNKI